jgi:phosphoglycerol transferase MdoB-like AlkP superfamily enzyme
MKYPQYIYIITWLKRSLLGLLILTICRLLFIFFNFNYFNNSDLIQLPGALFYGLIFDIQALIYCLIPFHLISLFPFKIKSNKHFNIFIKFTFILGIGVLLILNLIDFEFFKIKNRRSGIELFYLVNDPSNPLMSYLYNYWYLLILLIIFIFSLIKLYPSHPNKQISISNTTNAIVLRGSLFLVATCFLIIGARGGLNVKPLRSFDAARFVNPEWTSATINSLTQLLTSYDSKNVKSVNYFDNSVALELSNSVQSASPYSLKTQPNIVLIILESIGRDYCGFLNNKERYTPYLDQLSKDAYYYNHAYSNGYSSIESVPAIFASIPSLLDVPYINSNFQGNTLKGIHYYLNKSNYDCSFYYGTKNGSMGFLNFLKMCGPIDYYGLDEYLNKNDHDGHWGIWDLEYLKYYSNQLSTKKEPFFSSVFTLSSHDPYKIPNKFKGKFKEGELPIHKTVRYTDYALKEFFESAKKQKWFDNTIFIITADHTSYSKEEYFYSPTGKYEIPLLFYSPKLIKPGYNDSSTVSHCDIFPSIMSLCNIKDSIFSLGRNVFEPKKGYSLNYDNGLLQIIQYPYCLRMSQNGELKMHIQTKDMKNNGDIITQFDDSNATKIELTEILKAKHQYYLYSLLNNRFFVK